MSAQTSTAPGDSGQPYTANSRIASWDTLDEPIWDTVSRDISSIGLKLKHILMPTSEKEVYLNVCKNWDLWGPFIFCTYIAFSLNNCGEDCSGEYHKSNFSSIFVLLWLGNIAICLNYKLLLKNSLEKQGAVTSSSSNGSVQLTARYPMSIYQLLCLFGYSLAIPSIGIAILQVLSLFTNTVQLYEKLLVSLAFGFLYPVASILKMLSAYLTTGKTFLVVYPIILFFTVLSLYLYTFA